MSDKAKWTKDEQELIEETIPENAINKLLAELLEECINRPDTSDNGVYEANMMLLKLKAKIGE